MRDSVVHSGDTPIMCIEKAVSVGIQQYRPETIYLLKNADRVMVECAGRDHVFGKQIWDQTEQMIVIVNRHHSAAASQYRPLNLDLAHYINVESEDIRRTARYLSVNYHHVPPYSHQQGP